MNDPVAEYRRRLDAIALEEARYSQRDKILAVTKLLLGIVIVALAVWLVRYHAARLPWLLAPAACFAVLAVWHERVLLRLRSCRRRRAYYQHGLARIDGRWVGRGETGDRFLDPTHPYARDLDIFGHGSLFQLLATARTHSGEETLAAWLKVPAPLDEALARQQAVQELASELDFREQLAACGDASASGSSKGDELRAGIHPDALTAWAEGPALFSRRRTLALVLVLTLLWLASLVFWWKTGWFTGTLVLSLINLGVRYRLNVSITAATGAVEGAAKDLELLAVLVSRIERERFDSPRLQQVQAALISSETTASQAIARLGHRLDWLDSRDNLLVRPLDLFLFWTPFCAVALEAWRERFGAQICRWLAVTGETEALNSFAAYAYEHPADTFPEFIAGSGPRFDAEALAHPLLGRDTAISNDLSLDGDLRLLVISGPNMAGKSTFIRAVGLNAVLAHAGAPVCARRLSLSGLQVAASICILDSLQGGLSRFYAEISRLRQIYELSNEKMPVLFLLDELLSGTNSYDRRLGTESFLRSLLARQAIGLVTTHDLALAEIAERFGPAAANYHFEDKFQDGKLHFDYKLRPGIVQTTNALLLMRSIGLEV